MWMHSHSYIYQRLKHYINFTLEVIPDIKNVKNLSQVQQKNTEAEALLKKNTQQ